MTSLVTAPGASVAPSGAAAAARVNRTALPPLAFTPWGSEGFEVRSLRRQSPDPIAEADEDLKQRRPPSISFFLASLHNSAKNTVGKTLKLWLYTLSGVENVASAGTEKREWGQGWGGLGKGWDGGSGKEGSDLWAKRMLWCGKTLPGISRSRGQTRV